MEIFDTVIIGSGPAGVTAAIYAHRSNLKYLLLEKSAIGGKIINAYEVENYPGFLKVQGSDLALAFRSQVKSLNLNFKREEVLKIDKMNNSFFITTSKDRYESKTVVIATGTKENELNLPNEAFLLGRGVSYCATCDGSFYKDKDVIVYGGGDSAITEATFLSSIAKKVTIISRHELRGEPKNIDKLHSLNNIEYISNTTISELIGKEKLEKVKLSNGNELKVDGLFVYIGSKPKLDFLNKFNILNKKGYIEVDEHFNTKEKGIYAIGDVIEKELRQVVTATSDGARVIQTILKDIK